MRATGVEGELRVCYQEAGRLGAWSMDQVPGPTARYRVKARLLSEHTHWINERPLDIALWLGRTEWLWRDIVLSREDGFVVVDVAEPPIVGERAPSRG